MWLRTTPLLVSVCLLYAAAGAGLAAAANENDQSQSAATTKPGGKDWEKRPYILKDGKVDYGVYNGYRRYANTCLRCHGPDAMGSSYAPALANALKKMPYDTFLEKVTNGVKRTGASGNSVMPAFGEVEDVMTYVDHIYAYLKARADGAIGRGRPERLPKDQDPVYKEYQSNQ